MLGTIYQLSKLRFGMSLLESLTIPIMLTVITGYIIGLMADESQIPSKKMLLMALRGIIPTFAIGWGLRLVYDLLIFDDLLLTVMSYDPGLASLSVEIVTRSVFDDVDEKLDRSETVFIASEADFKLSSTLLRLP